MVTFPSEPDLRAVVLDAARRFGACNVRVFGSFARGDFGPGSDLDLLVAFEPDRSLLDHVGLIQELEERLERKVDVVAERGLSPYLRDAILAEARPL
jgi:predicted nucleotidyltransferase